MTTHFRILYVEKNDTELIVLWDKAVKENALPPQASYAWKTNLENIYGANACALLAVDSENNVAGFALVFFKKGEEVLYSCPHGFFAKNEAAAIALRDEIKAIAQKNNLRKTVITSGTLALDLPTKQNGKAGLYLPLAYADEEKLWLSIPNKTKNMIRKADKAGITISYDWKHLDAFYAMYMDRCSEKSLGIKPLKHFQSIKNLFGDNAVFIGALQNKKLVAGMIFISAGTSVSYAYNASIINASSSGANNLLMWEAMRFFYRKAARYIDLSESTPGSPVYKFKMRLSKDIECKEIHYYDFLSESEFAANRKISAALFFKYKVQGVLARLMPILPTFLKKKYLQYLGMNGRIM